MCDILAHFVLRIISKLPQNTNKAAYLCKAAKKQVNRSA